MRLNGFFLLLLSLIFAAPLAGHAQDATRADPLVKLRILPAYNVVKPGEDIWVGIEQSIEPHWHTYWKNPGDSGSAPRINWTLPPGFEISDIQWPVPEKLPYGPLLNYGYEDHVILLQKLHVPEEIPAGPLSLKADIEILVCKEECIPEYASMDLILNAPDQMVEDNSGYLDIAVEKLPKKTDWSVSYLERDQSFVLLFPPASGMAYEKADLTTIEFFPLDWGLVHNPAPQGGMLTEKALIVEQQRGERPLTALEDVEGILTFEIDGVRHGYHFLAKKGQEVESMTKNNESTPDFSGENARPTSLFMAFFLALLGGVILNLMPCVFPVLSIKALSLIKIADKDASLARLHGLSYTGGVITSFLMIAGLLIGLKAAGAEIGWGFQLQNAVVVALLAYLLFILGLNFAGLFEFSGRFANLGQRLTQGSGLGSSFFTGVLATLVATPCTAPFMAAALGYALVQPAPAALAVFAALGLGLALPYLLLAFIPALQRGLPKPGPWMEVFRQFLAFPMFASAAWLVWVMSQQAGTASVLGVLMGMVLVAFAVWLLRLRPGAKATQITVKALVVLSLLAALALLPFRTSATYPVVQTSIAETPVTEPERFGEVFSPQVLEEALASADPVFVEMTAAWCITCKVNHAVAINTKATRALFARRGVRFLIGDWTNQDPVITDYLSSYGRAGVPLYVFYGAPDPQSGQRPDPVVLPQLLTPGLIAETIGQEG